MFYSSGTAPDGPRAVPARSGLDGRSTQDSSHSSLFSHPPRTVPSAGRGTVRDATGVLRRGLQACVRRVDLHYARVTDQSNPPKQRGCFFYGCLVLAVAGLLAIALGVAGFFIARSTAKRWINDYTSTAPELIEKVE